MAASNKPLARGSRTNALSRVPSRDVYKRQGNCYDNSVMENFFGILKQEMYYGTTYYSFEELKEDVYKRQEMKLLQKTISQQQARQQH